MGLDTTHGCWHGPYSSFMRWRREVARCIGIKLDLMDGFYHGTKMEDGRYAGWSNDNKVIEVDPPMRWDGVIDPLRHLLNHSDCDGELSWEICADLADRLEAIAPLMPEEDGGWMRSAALRFAAGCRAAHAAKENVEFH